MKRYKTIAIDAMGGDFGPEVTIPAALKALQEFPELKLILVGKSEDIAEQLLKHGGKESAFIKIQHATEVVAMDESPVLALKKKKDSSMRIAIDLVKSNTADACVSAGNTGALMATSKFVLKTIKGINRPAICSSLPSKTGHTHMLDLGANIECSAEQLFQFAVMGSILASAVDHKKDPSIGLLNIGSEAIKGSETIKAASQLLQNSGLNYVGYVEGDDIYKGGTDVIVTDGFSGNISLKTGEGLASFVSHVLREGFSKNIFTKIMGLIAYPVLASIKIKLDPRRYNGASLLGLKGIVVKSHGGADSFAFYNAIKIAYLEAEESITEKITDEISRLLLNTSK